MPRARHPEHESWLPPGRPFPRRAVPEKLTSRTASRPKSAHLKQRHEPAPFPKSAHSAVPAHLRAWPQESSPQPAPEAPHRADPGRPAASGVAPLGPSSQALGKAFDSPRKPCRHASRQEHIHSPGSPKVLTSNVSAGHIHSPQAPQRLTQVPKVAHPESRNSFTDKDLAALQSSSIQFRYLKLFKASGPELKRWKPETAQAVLAHRLPGENR